MAKATPPEMAGLSFVEIAALEQKRLLDRIAELESKLESESNRANHEERLRQSAERDCRGLSKGLEDEIRKNAALVLEADHQRKCAKEWFDRMQAAESRLDSLRQNLAVAHSILNDAMAEQDYHVDVSRTAVWLAANERVVERQEIK